MTRFSFFILDFYGKYIYTIRITWGRDECKGDTFVMDNQKTAPKVYVNTLGEFSVTIGRHTVNNQNHQSRKAWLLLEYLLAFHNRAVAPEELIELIWKDEEISNPYGALKTLMFRSRKLLCDLGYPPQQIIILHRGSYAWNNELNTIIDADIFERFANKGLSKKGADDVRLAACMKALQLYKGDFLPNFNYEPWVVPISTYYHTLYQKTAHTAMDILMKREDYAQIVELCQKAVNIEPFDEVLHYNLILALFRSGNQQAALDHYNHTVNLLYNEFAITPSEQLKSLYKIIQDTRHGIITDLSLVQDSLMEEGTLNGAFFCEYVVFKDIYQLESRSITRTGDSVHLCLITLSDAKGNLLPQTFLSRGMELLKDSIRSSLRRGDIYCRYSVSQYILLLPTTTYENGEMILKRITRNFHQSYTRRDMSLRYSLQAVLAQD